MLFRSPDNRPLSRDSPMYLAERGEYLLAARRGGTVWLTRGSITACRWCQLAGWLSRLTESGPAARSWGIGIWPVMYTRRAPQPSQRVIGFICYCVARSRLPAEYLRPQWRWAGLVMAPRWSSSGHGRADVACWRTLPTTPAAGRRRFAVPSAAGHLPVVRWAESCSLLGVLAAGL